jgi:hypothetical protein
LAFSSPLLISIEYPFDIEWLENVIPEIIEKAMRKVGKYSKGE